MIRLATIKDLDDIMEIIKQAQIRMKLAGMTQWQNNYPNNEIILKDINENALYVYIKDKKIIGTMSVFDSDPVYENIEGSWLNDEPFKAIHRIAVHDEFLNQGISKKMLNNLVILLNVKNIKIDTHPKNISMIKSLETQGFSYCGIVHVTTDSDSLRYAYQKVYK